MSLYYDQPRLRQRGPEDFAGVLVLLTCAVLAFALYLAVLRNQQCLEIFLYVAILFFDGGLLLAQLVGRRRKREETRPHPAILIPASKDAATVRDINQGEATLLGHNVHKEPWLWPDIVRMKHGVIVGGTGSDKSTFLENIIALDVMRRFGRRKMPMIIFDGKGEQEFLNRLLPHIETAGCLKDLRVIDLAHHAESARCNPFYALEDAYQEHVNFSFRSFGLREDFFKGHQEAYLSDLVRTLQYTGKLFNVSGIFSTRYTETGTGSDIKETRAREDHINNLPVGQMEILMVDSREGTRYSHLHVRRVPRFQVEGLESSLYPKMHSYFDPEIGVNLRFKEVENRKQQRRRTVGLFLGEAGGE